MAIQWFSRNKEKKNVQNTTVQNRYEVVSNEIKTRKEYEYSLQLFRLWYNFVHNCINEFKKQANLEPSGNIIISLYALALYNSIYGGFPRQNDKINDTALDVLRCYTWKQLIEVHGINDADEKTAQLFIAKVEKQYMELDKYMGELLNSGISEKDILIKKNYYVMKQFGQMDPTVPIIMAIEEVTFLDKYGGFLSLLPSRWKNQPQENNCEIKKETKQNQYHDKQTNNNTALPPEYNDEVQKTKQKHNYHKMQEIFQILYKAVDKVKQECLAKGDIESYNRIDIDALWGTVLYFYTICYKPDNLKDKAVDYFTLIDILTIWFWENERDQASALSRVNRIIDNTKAIHNEMSKNDTPNDEKHTLGLIMAVVSRSVFHDRNDLESIKKHYDYCRDAIKYTLEMIKKVNQAGYLEQGKETEKYISKKYEYDKGYSETTARSTAETKLGFDNRRQTIIKTNTVSGYDTNETCAFTIIDEKRIKCNRCGEVQSIRRIGGVCYNCGVRLTNQATTNQ